MDNEKGTVVSLHDGYVAFLDVLGFRSIVASQNSSERLTNYIGTVEQATQVQGKDALQYVIFSDSVVVNSTNDDDQSFESILEACATLFAEFLHEGIAVRGAIARTLSAFEQGKRSFRGWQSNCGSI